MGSPLYRQEQELNRQGIPLSRQTMSNWILKAAETYLAPVYEQLHRELLTRDVLHADETTLQVLHEPGKKPQTDSYMWLYRTSGDTDKPVVLYEYQPGRGAKYPEEFLKDFKGYLHTDGYAVYHGLPEGITVVGCHAHLHRKFDDAIKSIPKGKVKDGRLELSNNRAERSIKPFVISRKNFLIFPGSLQIRLNAPIPPAPGCRMTDSRMRSQMPWTSSLVLLRKWIFTDFETPDYRRW